MRNILTAFPTLLLFVACGSSTQDDSQATVLQSFSISGKELKEASDLAFDKESNTLYIVGDKGILYSYNIALKDENRSMELEYMDEYNITDTQNDLPVDSEGLTMDDHQGIVVSFEGKARVSNISRDGIIGQDKILPEILADNTVYKDANSIFEGVAFHDIHGLIVAAETPINNKPRTDQTIYSLSGEAWHFKAESYKNSAVTGLEVMSDGNLLVLERAQDETDTHYFHLTLKKVYINECDSKRLCESKVVYQERIYAQNYEGIARIDKNRYLLVADNQNVSVSGLYLSTYFMYLEIK